MRVYKRTTVSYYLSTLLVLTWLPLLATSRGYHLAWPALSGPIALACFLLALGTRRRVQQGLEVPPQPGQVALTLTLGGLQGLAGCAVAVFFVLFILVIGRAITGTLF